MQMEQEKVNQIAVFYYSRKDVQEAILKFCQDRETVPRYYEGFGKRPDSLQYPSDILQQVKKGATSFHCSEELWQDPLQISTDMSKEKFNELRKGWDLLIDIDCKWFDYSKKAAKAVIQALHSQGIKNVGLKFSVSGDTPILVKTNEEINLIPISEAISIFKQGKKIKVLSLDKDKRVTFSEVYDSLEHDEEIYEIYHEQSVFPVKATKHHSVFVWDQGEIMQKKVEEMKEGDFLITYNSKSNNLSLNEKEIKNNFSLNRNQFKNRQFTNNVPITPELMRLIGYFLAEGHVTNIINQTGFTFNVNETEYIEDVISILKNITGRKISTRHPNPHSTQILIHSKEWATFFDKFCGKKKEKHVPSFSWSLPKELFLEMLKGYIRGDGHKRGEYTITIKSVSKKLITEFIWLCKLNGISCSLRQEYNKPHKLPQGTEFRGSLVYILSIPKSELLGEFHRVRNKFSPFPRDRTFPIDGLKIVCNQIMPKKFLSHRKEHVILRKKRANLERIKHLLEWFEKFNSIEPDENSKRIMASYQSLFNSDVGIVQVNKIIKKEKEKVFDVSVKETEAFFGNYYPILLHNSGGKGWHIIVPWQAFPEEMNSVPTKEMFPEWPRIICEYLKVISRDFLEKEILESGTEYQKLGKEGVKCNSCGNLAEKFQELTYYCERCRIKETFKTKEEKKPRKCSHCRKEMLLADEKEFHICQKCQIDSRQEPENFSSSIDIFGILGLDLVLVSPRHLFRCPYSLHEKTGFASVVISEEELDNFNPKDAEPLKVQIRNFLPNSEKNEARTLLVRSLEWHGDRVRHQVVKEEIKEKKTKFEEISVDKSSLVYPPAVKKILEGMDDGRKRGLFILINFFRCLGFTREETEKKVEEWNKKNPKPLKVGYVKSQIEWTFRQKKMLPPNYDKPYYKDIGVSPDDEELRLKNPVSYAIRKSRRLRK